MKNFILKSGCKKTIELAQFSAMLEDWNSLSKDQQIGCILKMVATCNLSIDQKNRVSNFVRNCDKVCSLGYRFLTRDTRDNIVVFYFAEVAEYFPTMVEVNEDDYNRFLEDADDELNK